jgi:transcriptional regulator with XRE-family HTH domain
MQAQEKPDDLPGRLRRICEQRGWRQKDLAGVLGANLDRIKSLMSGKAKKLEAGEIDTLVDQYQVRREYLASGVPPVFKTEAELRVERELALIGKATQAVASMNIPDWAKRVAHEWVYAVDRGDAERVMELAGMAAGVGEPRPDYQVARPPDDKTLESVMEAVLAEVARTNPGLAPQKIASIILAMLEGTPPGQAVNPATVARLVRLAT